jgi:hypothetical protein
MIWIIASLIVVALLCRFVPGPKCITYCAIRKKGYRRSLNRIRKYVIIDNSDRFVSADFSTLSSKTLQKMFADTTPFGCESISRSGESIPVPNWVPSARQALKEVIAERLLLEIK